MSKNIAIYRNQLFKISESFITYQAESLKAFRPVYIGRKAFGDAPIKSKVITLEKYSLIENLRYMLFRGISSINEQIDKEEKPVLIHAYFAVEAVYAMRLSKTLNIPLITTFLGFDATTTTRSLITSGKPAWINYALYKKQLIKNGDMFICVSDFIRDRVISMGFPAGITITHYIGVDVSKPLPVKKSLPYKVILHVARLTEKKGTNYLLDAFSIVAKEDESTRLIVIGDGPLMHDHKKHAESLGLSEQVDFLGFQTHDMVMDWMSKTDIVCMPSITAESGDTEGLPMTILEASAYKIPVVSTFHAGIPEAIEDGVSGYLVPERNVPLLADRLSVLLKDEKLRLQMGESGRKIVKEKFNLKIQAEKLEQIYKMVLK